MSFILLARLASSGLTVMMDEDLNTKEFETEGKAVAAVQEFNEWIESEHEHIVDFQVIEVEV